MTTATALRASLLASAFPPGPNKAAPPVFACNLKAISASEHARYHDLSKRVRAAIRGRAETADGYTLTLDGYAVSLTEAAEWINFERLCCPFLTMNLSASGDQADWVLALTGPRAVKPLLNAEFPPKWSD